jgi:hypothetical protein
VDSFSPSVIANHHWFVWVWVADFVGADTLHEATVSAPNLGEVDHVVIGWAVNSTAFVTYALVCGMDWANYLPKVVLPVSLVVVYKFRHVRNIA